MNSLILITPLYKTGIEKIMMQKIWKSCFSLLLVSIFWGKMVVEMKISYEVMFKTKIAVAFPSYHIFMQHHFNLNEFSLGNSIGNFLESYVCSLEAQIGEHVFKYVML